jgi:GTP-binding protein
MDDLLDTILKHVPAPKGDVKAPFQFQVTSLDYNSFIGGIAIGRIRRGSVSVGQDIAVVRQDSKEVRTGKVRQESGGKKLVLTRCLAKVAKIMTFMGMDRVEATHAYAGDIVALSGVETPRISDTWSDVNAPEALPLLKVDEPTLSATFEVNTSPLAGKEGTMLTSRQLRERLLRETLTNVALKVEETTGSTSGGAFKGKSRREGKRKRKNQPSLTVSGRGELHLGILIETMRREGFELSVGRPSVIRKIVDGVKMEPFENL